MVEELSTPAAATRASALSIRPFVTPTSSKDLRTPIEAPARQSTRVTVSHSRHGHYHDESVPPHHTLPVPSAQHPKDDALRPSPIPLRSSGRDLPAVITGLVCHWSELQPEQRSSWTSRRRHASAVDTTNLNPTGLASNILFRDSSLAQDRNSTRGNATCFSTEDQDRSIVPRIPTSIDALEGFVTPDLYLPECSRFDVSHLDPMPTVHGPLSAPQLQLDPLWDLDMLQLEIPTQSLLLGS